MHPPRTGLATSDAVPDGADGTGRVERTALVDRLPAIVRPLAIYVASRAVTYFALGAAAYVSPTYTLRDVFGIWDSLWYVMLAESGYPHAVPRGPGGVVQQSPIAFFPVFPMAARALSRATGLSYLGAGVLLAGVFGALAAVAVWSLVRHIAGLEVADRSVALFCFFPGSFVLSLNYSEGLMIALAAACLLALVSRRWLLAGLAAGLATATRPTAVALIVVCVWEAVGAARRREWRAVVAPALAPAGMVAFFAFLAVRTGETQAWLETQRDGWHQKVDFGASTARQIVDTIHHPLPDVNQLSGALSVLFLVVAAYLLWRARLPAALVVYTAAVVSMSFLTEVTSGRPRFLLVAFPLLVGVATRIRGTTFAVVVGCSAVLMTVLVMVTMAVVPTMATSP
jgi:hypothetical protein